MDRGKFLKIAGYVLVTVGAVVLLIGLFQVLPPIRFSGADDGGQRQSWIVVPLPAGGFNDTSSGSDLGGWGGDDWSSGTDAGSWDSGSDSGSWDSGGWDSGSWDSGGYDSGSWDSGGSDSGSW